MNSKNKFGERKGKLLPGKYAAASGMFLIFLLQSTIMEEPTMESLKWFNYACKTQGINRAFTFHPELADKFRQLKKKLDAEQKIEVDLDLERRLVEEAKRKYDHIS